MLLLFEPNRFIFEALFPNLLRHFSAQTQFRTGTSEGADPEDPDGGTAELAGTSATSTVSLTDLGPLTPGVTYEFWLVGHNSQGDGPESNHTSHVAT